MASSPKIVVPKVEVVFYGLDGYQEEYQMFDVEVIHKQFQKEELYGERELSRSLQRPRMFEEMRYQMLLRPEPVDNVLYTRRTFALDHHTSM